MVLHASAAPQGSKEAAARKGLAAASAAASRPSPDVNSNARDQIADQSSRPTKAAANMGRPAAAASTDAASGPREPKLANNGAQRTATFAKAMSEVTTQPPPKAAQASSSAPGSEQARSWAAVAAPGKQQQAAGEGVKAGQRPMPAADTPAPSKQAGSSSSSAKGPEKPAATGNHTKPSEADRSKAPAPASGQAAPPAAAAAPSSNSVQAPQSSGGGRGGGGGYSGRGRGRGRHYNDRPIVSNTAPAAAGPGKDTPSSSATSGGPASKTAPPAAAGAPSNSSSSGGTGSGAAAAGVPAAQPSIPAAAVELLQPASSSNHHAPMAAPAVATAAQGWPSPVRGAGAYSTVPELPLLTSDADVAGSNTLSPADPQLQPAAGGGGLVLGSFPAGNFSQLTGSPGEQLGAGEGAADVLPPAAQLLGGSGDPAEDTSSSSHWGPLQLGQGPGQQGYGHQGGYPSYGYGGYQGGYDDARFYSGPMGYGHSDSGVPATSAAPATGYGYPPYSTPMAVPSSGGSERGFEAAGEYSYQHVPSYGSGLNAGAPSYQPFIQPAEPPPAVPADTVQVAASEVSAAVGGVARRVSDARDLEQQMLAAANAGLQPQGPSAEELRRDIPASLPDLAPTAAGVQQEAAEALRLMTALHQRYQQLQQDAAAADATRGALATQLERALDQLGATQQQLAAATSRAATAEGQLSSLQGQVYAAQSEAAQARRAADEAHAAHDELRRTAQAAEVARQEAVGQQEALAGQVAELQEQLADQQAKNAGMEQELAGAHSGYARMQADLDKVRKDEGITKQLNVGLRNRIATLEAQVKDLERAVAAAAAGGSGGMRGPAPGFPAPVAGGSSGAGRRGRPDGMSAEDLCQLLLALMPGSEVEAVSMAELEQQVDSNMAPDSWKNKYTREHGAFASFIDRHKQYFQRTGDGRVYAAQLSSPGPGPAPAAANGWGPTPADASWAQQKPKQQQQQQQQQGGRPQHHQQRAAPAGAAWHVSGGSSNGASASNTPRAADAASAAAAASAASRSSPTSEAASSAPSAAAGEAPGWGPNGPPTGPGGAPPPYPTWGNNWGNFPPGPYGHPPMPHPGAPMPPYPGGMPPAGGPTSAPMPSLPGALAQGGYMPHHQFPHGPLPYMMPPLAAPYGGGHALVTPMAPPPASAPPAGQQ